MDNTHGPAQDAIATQWEQRVLALVGEGRSVRVDELDASDAEVRISIASGMLRLAVVQRVWGVEFYVVMGRGPLDRERLYRAH